MIHLCCKIIEQSEVGGNNVVIRGTTTAKTQMTSYNCSPIPISGSLWNSNTDLLSFFKEILQERCNTFHQRKKKIRINFSVHQSFSRFLSSSLRILPECSCEGGCVVPNLDSRGLCWRFNGPFRVRLVQPCSLGCQNSQAVTCRKSKMEH